MTLIEDSGAVGSSLTIGGERLYYTGDNSEHWGAEPWWVENGSLKERWPNSEMMGAPTRWVRLVLELPVSPLTRLLASVLAQHWPTIEPSKPRLEALTGCDEQTVRWAIEAMEQIGLVEVERARGMRHRYHLCWPQRAVTADEWADIHKKRRKKSK